MNGSLLLNPEVEVCVGLGLEVLTRKEAAKFLNITLNMFNWITHIQGAPPRIEINKKHQEFFYFVSELEAWHKKHLQKQPKQPKPKLKQPKPKLKQPKPKLKQPVSCSKSTSKFHPGFLPREFACAHLEPPTWKLTKAQHGNCGYQAFKEDLAVRETINTEEYNQYRACMCCNNMFWGSSTRHRCKECNKKLDREGYVKSSLHTHVSED